MNFLHVLFTNEMKKQFNNFSNSKGVYIFSYGADFTNLKELAVIQIWFEKTIATDCP